ncbi:hypothetical protein [Streptomyces sp. Mo3]|uniref:hypothetical protein n=1 Tax=Streptomyces sp. Mo3 TaxID=3161190 RepID=UPI000E750174
MHDVFSHQVSLIAVQGRRPPSRLPGTPIPRSEHTPSAHSASAPLTNCATWPPSCTKAPGASRQLAHEVGSPKRGARRPRPSIRRAASVRGHHRPRDADARRHGKLRAPSKRSRHPVDPAAAPRRHGHGRRHTRRGGS